MADARSIEDPHLYHLFDGEPVLNVYKSEVTNLSAGTPGPDLLKQCIEMFKHATEHRMVNKEFPCKLRGLWSCKIHSLQDQGCMGKLGYEKVWPLFTHIGA
jgi:hypothetical protein